MYLGRAEERGQKSVHFGMISNRENDGYELKSKADRKGPGGIGLVHKT